MAIETTKDPRTKKEVTFVSGKVEKIYMNPLKEVKTYTTGKAPWTPTHSVNIVVDGTKVALGLTDKEVLRAKAEDDKYHDVLEGHEVSIEIDKIGEYQGKPQYNAKTSSVFIVSLEGGVTAQPKQAPQQGQSSGQTYGKKDNTGIETGHALNGAMLFLGPKASLEEYVAMAKQVHAITAELKAEYKAKEPSFSEYDIGAAAGNAILNALQIAAARKKPLEDVPALARKWLYEAAVAVKEYIKPSAKPAPEPEPEVPESVPEVDASDDIDDDLPF